MLDFTLQGSNDNVNWTNLLSVVNAVGGTRSYNVGSSTPYRFYQILITRVPNDNELTTIFTIQGFGEGGNTPKLNELRGAGSPSQYRTTCCTDQPVNLVTGNFWHTFTDLSLPGRDVPLQFNRTYNSQAATESGTLGYGWTHNFNMFISRDQDNNYIVHEENGSVAPFAVDFSHSPKVMATLTNTNGAVVFSRTHGKERFYFRTISDTLKLTEVVDTNGYTTTLSYQSGLLRTVTDPVGRSLTFTYTDGLLTSVGDPGNRTIAFDYDSNGDLISASDLSGRTTQFKYDANHRLLSMTHPIGGLLTNIYDDQNRVVSQTDPLSRTLQFEYAAFSTRVTDTVGLVSVYSHIYNRLIGEDINVTGQQSGWNYSYEPDTTRIDSAAAPNGGTWRYTWDSNGNRTKVTDPLTRTTTYTYTNVLLPSGDTKPLVAAEEDALGRVTRFGYDSLGQPTVITNTLNQASRFEYDSRGRLTRSTDPTGVAECREYDTQDNLTAVVRNCVTGQPSTSSQNVRTEYGYDVLGRQTWERNALGEVSRTFYTTDDRITKTVVGCALGGIPSTTDCDPFNSATPELNRTTSYGYDQFGRQVAITDTLGIVTRTDYDSMERPWRTIRNYDPTRPADASTNVTTTIEYDSASRVSATVDALGRRSVSGYDNMGRLITQTLNYVDGNPLTGDPDTDLVTRTEYNAVDQPVTTTVNYIDGVWDSSRPDEDVSTVTRYDELERVSLTIENYVDGVASSGEVDTDRISENRYDAVGNMVATIDPAGRVTVQIHNDLGQTVEEIYNCTDGNGQPRTTNCATGHGAGNDENIRSSMQYNSRGEVEVRTDPLGRRTRTSYDALSRMVEQISNDSGTVAPLNVSTRYGYDALGHTVVITDALGGLQRSEYNQAGWLQRQIDPTNRDVRFSHDGLGRSVKQIDALNKETRTIYDPLGRMVKTVVNWQNGMAETGDDTDQDLTSEVVYDVAGRQLAQIGTDGKRTNYTYDQMDRLVTVVENAGGTVEPSDVATHYSYDRRGLLKLITDALGRQRQRGYNAAGWQVSDTDALSRTTTFGYDRAGSKTSVIDPRPITTTYGYDGLQRLTSISASGLSTISMAYDAGSRRTTMTDGTGTTTYTYDGLDRATEAAHSVDGTVTHGYDLLGRRTSLGTSTGAPAVTYSYDAAGRMEQVYRAGTLHAGATYDTLGRLQNVARANGATTTFQYDGADRLAELRTATGGMLLRGFQYKVNRGGQVTVALESTGLLSTKVTGYSYDGLRRLTEAAELPGRTYVYRYDAVGNMLVNGTLTNTRSYDAADQVIGWQYDGAGNLLNDGTSTYAYDALKQLSSVTNTSSGSITGFGYNGEGVLVTETAGGVTTRYTLDTMGGLPERMGSTTGGSTTWYVRGYGQELSKEASGGGGALTWYLYDRLGSVRGIADGAGALTAQYDYEPFGTPQGIPPQDYGYTGEPHGTNGTVGGLVHLRARWYNAGAGKFLTHDPLAGWPQHPMSLHRYMYSYDDPVNRTDPTGMASQGCLAQTNPQLNWKTKCAEMVETVQKIINLAKQGSDNWLYSLLNGRDPWRDATAAYLAYQFSGIPIEISRPALIGGLPGIYYSLQQLKNNIPHDPEVYKFYLPGSSTRVDAGHVKRDLGITDDELMEANSVPVLNYGFKPDYWSNSHHFFAMFFYGYVGGSPIGKMVNERWERGSGDKNPTDYRVGDLAAEIGGWFGGSPANPSSLPNVLREQMCLSASERANLLRYVPSYTHGR